MDAESEPVPATEPVPDSPPLGFKPLAAIADSAPVVVTKAVWQLAGTLRAIFDEMDKRPHPRTAYRWLSVLPGLGAISNYLGERGNGARRRCRAELACRATRYPLTRATA